MIIKGRVLSKEGFVTREVQTVNGRIVKVGNSLSDDSFYELGKDSILTSGIFDSHVHLRDLDQSYKETVMSGTYHLLSTGVLGAAAMPNTSPPLDSAEKLILYNAIISNTAHIKTSVYGLLTPKSNANELFKMAEHCNNKFKAFQSESVGSGFFTNNNELSDKILMLPKNAEIRIHCEDPKLLKDYSSNWNPSNPITHYDARPNIVEEEGVRFVVEEVLPKRPDLSFVICHLSSKEGLNIVQSGKKNNKNLFCETAYQYLYFNKEDFNTKKSLIKCNPSIKTEEDRLALIKGLNDGVIDYLVSDHAPHNHDEKITKQLSGMPSYDCGVLGWLINKGVNQQKLLNAASLNLKPSWEIKEGNPLMAIVLNMEGRMTTSTDLASLASDSPWIGETLPSLYGVFRGE
ncbi:Allantoinase [Candidatus Tiddalikarchaeum anstoanum]|nr:Allantoinase [Candidatus Tiddalikarchaeum anstoanum]